MVAVDVAAETAVDGALDVVASSYVVDASSDAAVEDNRVHH